MTTTWAMEEFAGAELGVFHRRRMASRLQPGEENVPKAPSTVRELIRQIAMLGGVLGRKGDGESGVKILSPGFQRVQDFVQGVEHMRMIRTILFNCTLCP